MSSTMLAFPGRGPDRLGTRLKVAQVGLGHWGGNLLRTWMKQPRAELVAVCDSDPARLEAARKRSPDVRAFQSLDDMLERCDIDAVSIATPSGLHFEHAATALVAGKAVFVEKPMTTTLEDSVRLARLAREQGRLLMVGHVYLYNDIVRQVKTFVVSGELGDVLYAYGQRLNLGMFRHDSDVIWTLSPHDVSIFNYWFDGCPHQVSARTLSCLAADRGQAEICFAQLDYPGGLSAHLHLSWLEPQKVRRSVVVGSRKMLVYDDVDRKRPVQIFDVAAGNRQACDATARASDVLVPDVSTEEPLFLEIEQFVASALDGAPCPSDAAHGVAVAAVMDALSRSARGGGVIVPVDVPVV